MMIKKKNLYKKGSLIIEIIITIYVLGLVLVYFLGLTDFTLRNNTLAKSQNIAANLAQEALEAVRNFRDGTTWGTNGIGKLTTDNPVGTIYHPVKTGGWQMVVGQETISVNNISFQRKVVFYPVNRLNDNIVEQDGTNDPDTIKVIVTILWADQQIMVVDYLTNVPTATPTPTPPPSPTPSPSSSPSPSPTPSPSPSPSPSPNNNPICDAGSNIYMNEGDTVTLGGSASDSDNDPLTYTWSCLLGSVFYPGDLNPLYTAPQVSSNTSVYCSFYVDDGRGGTCSDWTWIFVDNVSP